jgi:hypothetical protein
MNRTNRVHSKSWLGVLSLISFISAVATAQTSASEAQPLPGADAAFSEGVTLMKQERCEEAIAKFRESQRLEPASGTLLNLAYCQTRLGRVASAWRSYQDAIPLAVHQSKPQHEKLAREQSARLEPELPRLSIILAGASPRALTIELDGQRLAGDGNLVGMPVDPGAHRVSVKLENGHNWETTIALARAQQMSVEVPIADTSNASSVATTAASTKPQALAALPAPAPVTPRVNPAPASQADRATTRPSWALGVAIAGAGAVVTGSVLFATARVKYDAARERCSSRNACTQPWYDEQQDAIVLARISAAFLASGALVGGTGAYFYFSGGAPSKAGGPAAALAGSGDFVAGYRGIW